MNFHNGALSFAAALAGRQTRRNTEKPFSVKIFIISLALSKKIYKGEISAPRHGMA